MALGFDWKEYVEDTSPSEWTMAADGASATMTIQCDYNVLDDAARALLGFAFRSPDAPVGRRLKRVLPARHPLFPWMWCTQVNGRGLGPIGPRLNADPSSTMDFAANYRMGRLNLTFSTLPYDILPDDDASVIADGEWRRFTERNQRPASEGLSEQQGQWKFAEGAVGDPIPGGKSRIVTTSMLIWTWKAVPNDCIFDSSGFATNIEPIIGTINADSFAGRAAGTLLCMPPVYRPYTSPLRPGNLNASNRIWDVEFQLLYKDPSPRVGATRGHNLAPLPGDATGRWAHFTADGTGGTDSLYAAGNFPQLFESR